MTNVNLKMLKDTDGNAFVPFSTTDAVFKDGTNQTVSDLLDEKQATLVSGTNIKTINNESLLGSGNITVIQDMSNYLAKDNTTVFTPTGDYNPATKKYVDDNAGSGDAKDITCIFGEPTNWSIQTWPDFTNFVGSDVWTDGDNIYLSRGSSNQYTWDTDTSAWIPKTWNGFTNFTGEDLFTAGGNIYYAAGQYEGYYILNKSTSTWSGKSWNIEDFYASNIWTDGVNTYLSGEWMQYVFNTNTSQWDQKQWNGDIEDLYTLEGRCIWTDGENIYYSNGNSQYILDIPTSTWSTKIWNGLTNFDGQYVWTDGDNIYYSHGNSQYILNKSTDTWVQKTWTGLTNSEGMYFWKIDNDIYYSRYTAKQYKLDIPTMSVQEALNFILQNMNYAKNLYTNPSDTSDKNIWIETNNS